MIKLLALMALMVAVPVHASTIDQDKAKPAKSTILTSLTTSAAVRCVKAVPAFQSVAVNEIANDDGTTDVAVIDAAGRAALWSIRTDGAGAVVEGRGRLGGARQIVSPLRVCLAA